MNPTPEELEKTRVIKKLRLGEPGTKDAMDYYGEDLIAVRYRRLPNGEVIRTVELLDHRVVKRGRRW